LKSKERLKEIILEEEGRAGKLEKQLLFLIQLSFLHLIRKRKKTWQKILMTMLEVKDDAL